MEQIHTRHIFRVYNLPIEPQVGESFQAVVENIADTKKVWIAKDNNGICQGWGWVECHTQEDKAVLKSYLTGMTWRGQTLFTLE